MYDDEDEDQDELTNNFLNPRKHCYAIKSFKISSSGQSFHPKTIPEQFHRAPLGQTCENSKQFQGSGRWQATICPTLTAAYFHPNQQLTSLKSAPKISN